MVAIYVRLIQRELKTIDDIPKHLKAAVEKELEK